MTIISRMTESSPLPKRYLVASRHSAPPLPGLATRIVALWNAALDAIVPLGYEDETGFHYGTPPADRDIAK